MQEKGLKETFTTDLTVKEDSVHLTDEKYDGPCFMAPRQSESNKLGGKKQKSWGGGVAQGEDYNLSR